MKKPNKEMSLVELAGLDQALRVHIEELTKKRAGVRKQIEDACEHEWQPDGKHLAVIAGGLKIQKQLRESVKMKPDAVDIFKKTAKNPEKYITQILSTKDLASAVKLGDFDVTDIAELTQTETSFVLIIKKHEETGD